ncbi:MAG: Cna B-type domain-containing protein, partial [Eubacteriales bacterium]|nr:Cna B-type domain-containing protein [Eubacteriales bacterium]
MKKSKAFFRYIWMVITAFLIFSAVPVSAKAEGGSIQITQLDTATKKPVKGVKLSLYKIADVNADNNSFKLTSAFASLGISLDDLGEDAVSSKVVAALDKHIETQHPESISTQVTDENGKVQFSGLADALYFVKQTNTAEDDRQLNYHFETESYLIPIPRMTETGITREISCQPKGTLTELKPETVKLVIYKIWKDNNNKHGKRPEQIDAQILNGTAVYKTVHLNASNNWQYSEEGLDGTANWSVKELNVPGDYESKVTKDGVTTFTITNTYVEDETETESEYESE